MKGEIREVKTLRMQYERFEMGVKFCRDSLARQRREGASNDEVAATAKYLSEISDEAERKYTTYLNAKALAEKSAIDACSVLDSFTAKKR